MFYLGQTVLIICGDIKVIGIYLGDCQDGKGNVWVYHNYSDDTQAGDAFLYKKSEVQYLFCDETTPKIYLGPFCTYRLSGTLTQAFGEKYEPEMLNEINGLTVNEYTNIVTKR